MVVNDWQSYLSLLTRSQLGAPRTRCTVRETEDKESKRAKHFCYRICIFIVPPSFTVALTRPTPRSPTCPHARAKCAFRARSGDRATAAIFERVSERETTWWRQGTPRSSTVQFTTYTASRNERLRRHYCACAPVAREEHALGRRSSFTSSR